MGILIMHYMGMWAQRTQVSMELDIGIFILSVVIAIASASAAFWILFRLLTFWETMEWVRVASALVMALAVCGTHYTGMLAAKYSYEPSLNVDTTGFINSKVAGNFASHGSLLVCYILCVWGVVANQNRTIDTHNISLKLSSSKPVLPKSSKVHASVSAGGD